MQYLVTGTVKIDLALPIVIEAIYESVEAQDEQVAGDVVLRDLESQYGGRASFKNVSIRPYSPAREMEAVGVERLL